MIRDGGAAHGDAVLHAGIGFDRLVRRRVDGHQQPSIESEARKRLLRAHKMPEVRRVERPAEDPDAGHAAGPGPQDRICPSPSTTYLSEQSSRRPIGPRAWSFCVEFPISAPMPNSPPSVNRVEALT